MIIEDIRTEPVDGKPRLTARVVWEDSDRPPIDIYFGTESAFADALAVLPDPFLAATLTPAMWAGEKRIRVDGEVCPELMDNLAVVRSLFQHWFNVGHGAAAIEARPRPRPHQESTERRAACFLSGGLDSLAAFRANRLNFPREHPESLKDGIIVFGLEVENERSFSMVLDTLTEFAQEAECRLVPVFTNVRMLNPDWRFWYNAHMGPALCAVAHAFQRRFSSVTVGSDYDVAHLVPHGSHPLVEPNFSSYSLRVHYHGLTLSRLGKARLIADWPAALRHLRVCNVSEGYQRGSLNCGRCEKCIRTMLELMAVGVFDKAPVFQQREISPRMIERLYMPGAIRPYYEELIGPLAAAGRPDLDDAIQQRLTRSRWTRLTEHLRTFDREFLNGSLVSLKRAVRRQAFQKGIDHNPATAVGSRCKLPSAPARRRF